MNGIYTCYNHNRTINNRGMYWIQQTNLLTNHSKNRKERKHKSNTRQTQHTHSFHTHNLQAPSLLDWVWFASWSAFKSQGQLDREGSRFFFHFAAAAINFSFLLLCLHMYIYTHTHTHALRKAGLLTSMREITSLTVIRQHIQKAPIQLFLMLKKPLFVD